MKVSLICIGKTKDAYLQEGIKIYTERLKHYLKFELLELPDVKLKGSKIQEAQVKNEEAKKLDKALETCDHIILFDEFGKEFTSVQFSQWWEKKNLMGVKHMALVIGGAYGFDESIHRIAQQKIALSKMTFSHQMIRLLAVEQIYRAQTILANEPYHHV